MSDMQDILCVLYACILWLQNLKVCLVGVKTGRMKNRERKIWWKMLFFTVWLGNENRRDRKHGRKFSLPSPLFLSSKIWSKMWREKCCESTYTQIPRFSLLSQLQTQRLQTQQSFSQTSLNSSIIRLSEYKLKNTILKLIKL